MARGGKVRGIVTKDELLKKATDFLMGLSHKEVIKELKKIKRAGKRRGK